MMKKLSISVYGALYRGDASVACGAEGHVARGEEVDAGITRSAPSACSMAYEWR